jgi:hypothetical protein
VGAVRLFGVAVLGVVRAAVELDQRVRELVHARLRNADRRVELLVTRLRWRRGVNSVNRHQLGPLLLSRGAPRLLGRHEDKEVDMT